MNIVCLFVFILSFIVSLWQLIIEIEKYEHYTCIPAQIQHNALLFYKYDLLETN